MARADACLSLSVRQNGAHCSISVVLSCGAPFAHAAGGWTLTSTVTGASAPSGTTSSPAPFSALAASTRGSYLGWIAPYSSYGAGRFSAAGQALGPASVAGSSGSGIGPVGILFVAETPAGLLASDSVRSQVFEYDSSGVEVQTIGVPGAAAGELSAPGGVAVITDDTILVADTGNDRIARFSSSGTHLATYGSPGTLDGQLDGPAGIAVNPNGSFWIADTNNHRVQLWSAAGGHLLTFGVQGGGPVEMENPIGIGVLSSGEIVASDDNLDRVTRYSAAGTFVDVVADAGADPKT